MSDHLLTITCPACDTQLDVTVTVTLDPPGVDPEPDFAVGVPPDGVKIHTGIKPKL